VLEGDFNASKQLVGSNFRAYHSMRKNQDFIMA